MLAQGCTSDKGRAALANTELRNSANGSLIGNAAVQGEVCQAIRFAILLARHVHKFEPIKLAAQGIESLEMTDQRGVADAISPAKLAHDQFRIHSQFDAARTERNSRFDRGDGASILSLIVRAVADGVRDRCQPVAVLVEHDAAECSRAGVAT